MDHKFINFSSIVSVWRSGFCIVLLLLLLAGCNQNSGQGSGAIPRTATVALPTQIPTSAPSPVSTRVMPVEVLTPPPTRTITPIPDETYGMVVNVIDGSTIAVVMDGDSFNKAYEVRYLGVEAPDAATNPWGVVAYEKNQSLTNLQIVRLVRDETDFDAEGYLLRYVYVDNQLMSTVLAEQGLAQADIQEPNARFKEEILEAEARAREGKLGLWGPAPPTPTLARSEPAKETSETEEAATVSPTGTPQLTVEATLTTTVKATQTVTATVTVTATGTVESTGEPTAESTPEDE